MPTTTTSSTTTATTTILLLHNFYYNNYYYFPIQIRVSTRMYRDRLPVYSSIDYDAVKAKVEPMQYVVLSPSANGAESVNTAQHCAHPL